MSLIVPNADDTLGGAKFAALDQSEPDALDFEILSIRSSGVVSGCAVTSNNSAANVAVSAGTIVLGGATYTVSANATLGLPAAPADSRFDLVVVRVTAGVPALVVVQGTNSATNPEFPKSASVITGAFSSTTNVDLTTDVVLAALYRTGSTAVTTGRIVDKRTLISQGGIASQGSSAPAGGSTGNLYLQTGTPSGTNSGVWVKRSDGVWMELAQNVGAHFPIGGACFWPSTAAIPAGCVEANGQALSTSAYSALFAVYGYTHGGAGGTFNVPNWNNLFVRGTTLTGNVGVALGADSVTLSQAQLPAHSHDISGHTHTHSHTHDFSHDHTPGGINTGVSGAHTHTAGTLTVDPEQGHVHFSEGTGVQALFYLGQGGVDNGNHFIDVNTGFTTFDMSWGTNNVGGQSVSPHTHTMSGTTGPVSATHTHTLTLGAFSGNTGTPSTSVTSGPSTGTTGSIGSGTAVSTIPSSTQSRVIIRASLGADPAFVGGTAHWAQAQTINAQTASYTVQTTDIGELITVTAAGANNVTINSGLGFAAGQTFNIAQLGAGQTTVVAGGGVTLHGTPGLKLRAQYSRATVQCVGTDSYLLFGDISA